MLPSHFGTDTAGVNTTRRYLCEALSFQYRYIPIGLLERWPARINERAPAFRGRDELGMCTPKCSTPHSLTRIIWHRDPLSERRQPRLGENIRDVPRTCARVVVVHAQAQKQRVRRRRESRLSAVRRLSRTFRRRCTSRGHSRPNTGHCHSQYTVHDHVTPAVVVL